MPGCCRASPTTRGVRLRDIAASLGITERSAYGIVTDRRRPVPLPGCQRPPAYAGTAPITRASGKRHAVTRRLVRNKRLCQAGYLWAFSLLTASPGARAHYDKRREHGDSHAAANRHLASRYFGILYHCLQNHQAYDETTAFAVGLASAA